MKKIFLILSFCLYINLLYGQQTKLCDDEHKIGVIQSATDCNGNRGIVCFPRNNQESFDVQVVGPEQYADDKFYKELEPNICFETPYAGVYTIKTHGQECTFEVAYEPIQYGSLIDENTPPRNIRTDREIGTIQGSQSVSLTGGATYSIPISLPSGTNGMEPSLSVNYNSQAGVGLLGYGWSLGIGSSITRVAKNIYNDGIVEPIKLYPTDAFALDGKRLVLLEGIYGEASSTYATQEETFCKITMLEDIARDGFMVESKNGQKIYYGTTEDSRIGSGGRVITWQISKIVDNFGNYVEFKYKKVHDNYVLDEVNYTGNSTTG